MKRLMDGKKVKHWAFMVLVACVFASCASLQNRAERRAQMMQAVAAAVAERRLHVDITSMSTLRYGSRAVTTDFFLELRGDSVRSYLPYLGQARQAPMASPSQGLNFEVRAQRVSVTQPKADCARFEIDLRTREDSYEYVLELYDNGKAYIHVRSQNRDPISFDGDFVPLQ